MTSIIEQFDGAIEGSDPDERRIQAFINTVVPRMMQPFTDATASIVVGRSMAELKAAHQRVTIQRDAVEKWVMQLERTMAFTDELQRGLREILRREITTGSMQGEVKDP